MLRYATLTTTALIVITGCTAVGVLTHSVDTDATDARAGRYALDPDHHALLFKVGHLDYTMIAGRFDRSEATLDFEPTNPAASRLSVVVDAASVSLASDILTTLVRGDELLEVERYPEIRFTSTDIRVTGANTGEIDGELAMAGETHPITLATTFNGAAKDPLTGAFTMGFSATARLKRSDWGLGAWIPAVDDEVLIEIEAEFDLQEGDAAAISSASILSAS